jgi:uncharacterized membrane protein (DUF2068 family)
MKHPVLDNRRRLRVVAIVDIIKGVLILGIALGVLHASSHVLENGGLSLLRLLDVDRTLAIPRHFLHLMQLADGERGWITVAAAAYAMLRFVEAYGLWFTRNWARWLGLLSSCIYVPFELYYFLRGPSWTTFSVLLVNVIVVWLLWPRRNLPSSDPTASTIA